MPPPRIHIFIAADSYAASLHPIIIDHLKRKHAEDVQITDFGVYSKYYLAAHAVGLEVEKAAVEGNSSSIRGILCCGSGQGMAVIANKFRHVYACLCTTPEQAQGSRCVNNCNVLTMGARIIDEDTALAIVDAWLEKGLGDDLAPHLQEFVERSMPEIEALDFSTGAKRELADAIPPDSEGGPPPVVR